MRTERVLAGLVLCLVICLATTPVLAEPETTATKSDAGNLRVALLPFESDFQGNRDSGVLIAEILAARLSVSGNLTMVDRTDIDKILKEQGLGASGAVAADQAARIGRLLGAQLLITGRTATQGGKTLVFCKAISVESGQLKGLFLTLPKETDLPTLIDKTAAKLEESLPVWAKVLLPPASQPVDHAAALRKRSKGKILPGIAVLIPEVHFGRFVVDPAVETEFQMLLTEAGMSPVEVSPKIVKSLQATTASRAPSTGPASAVTVVVPSAQSRQAPVPVAFDPQQLRELFPNVRYLICGEAFSEDGRHLHGLVVSSARAEVKVVDLQSGKIILVDRATDHAPDLSARVAGKTALQKAGRTLALRMLPKLIDRFENQK